MSFLSELTPVAQVLLIICVLVILTNQQACNRFKQSINALRKLFSKEDRRTLHKRSLRK